MTTRDSMTVRPLRSLLGLPARRPRVELTTEAYMAVEQVGCPEGSCTGSIGRPCNKRGGGYHRSRVAAAQKKLSK